MSDYKAKAEPSGTKTIKGQAAASGPDYDALGEQAAWDAYKKANKLSFAASKTQHAEPFKRWRSAQSAQRAGQIKGVAGMGATEKKPVEKPAQK